MSTFINGKLTCKKTQNEYSLNMKDNGLIKKANKQNSIFIICPFCQLESFLREKFGDDIFFITTPAGILNFNENEIGALKYLINQEKINNIYLVNDVSCKFIDAAITNKDFGLPFEKELKRQFEQLNTHLENLESIGVKKIKLAYSNLKNQAAYIMNNQTLKLDIENQKIIIHQIIVNNNEIELSQTIR